MIVPPWIFRIGVQRAFHVFEGACVDQAARPACLLQRIADGKALPHRRVFQRRHQRVVDRTIMHEETAQACATLPSRADSRCEQNCALGQIGKLRRQAHTIIALLPPSSRSARVRNELCHHRRQRFAHPRRARRADERDADDRPRALRPPSARAPSTITCREFVRRMLPSSASRRARTAPVWQAPSAASCSDGFQITLSPQTSASAAFHAPHGDGKVERGDLIATGPSGSPLLHHAMAGPLGRDGEASKAGARDRLRNRRCRSSPPLHFAETFLQDLARF